jgi:hypothetical protein
VQKYTKKTGSDWICQAGETDSEPSGSQECANVVGKIPYSSGYALQPPATILPSTTQHIKPVNTALTTSNRKPDPTSEESAPDGLTERYLFMTCDHSLRLFRQRIRDNYNDYETFKQINAAYWQESGFIGSLCKWLRVKMLFGVRRIKVLID